MQYTKNLKLKKIELTDAPPDITAPNENFDILDDFLGCLQLKFYTKLNQIDQALTAESSIVDIIAKMPDNAMLVANITAENTNIYPVLHGILKITKLPANSAELEFISQEDAATQSGKKRWYAQAPDGKWTEWIEQSKNTEIVPIIMGGTGANNAAGARENLKITPENIGAQPAGNYQPAGSYASASHNHDSRYANLNHGHDYSPTGHNHDGTYAAIGHGHTPASIGAAYSSHNHDTLKSTHFVKAAYEDGAYSVTLADHFFFSENNAESEPSSGPYICAATQRSLDFLGYSITGKDFLFVGDVNIQGDIYGGPSIISSDARLKHDIVDIGDRYEVFFNALRPVTFIYNDKTRNHVGFIAQEVAEALEASGLTTQEFAGYVALPKFGEKEIERETETLEDVEVNVCDENGEVIETRIEKHTVPKTETVTVVDKENVIDTEYMLRYGEFVALNTHMIQLLMGRMSALEAKVAELEERVNGN